MGRSIGPIVSLTSAGMLDSLLSLLWMLVCVVVVVVLAYLFTKYAAGRNGRFVSASGGSERFRVLCRLSIGREQWAVLVQAGEQYLLLGVSQSGVSLLKELTAEEALSICPYRPDQPAASSFGEVLRNILKQRKPR